jgi:hypothetical protein
MTLKRVEAKTINGMQVVHMKDISLPEGLLSKFRKLYSWRLSNTSLSDGRFHYEIVWKNRKPLNLILCASKFFKL